MDLMEKIVNLAKRRGFIFPGSEIYGGLANSWDYGPLGAELKKNIKDEWWKRFVRQRADIVGLDAALMMNPKVWEASGHLKNFSDPLIECKKCHHRFRADQLRFLPSQGRTAPDEKGIERSEKFHELLFKNPKEAFEKYPYERENSYWDCPTCGGGIKVAIPKQFNLMFKTFMGPAEEKANEVYLRPETAQAMFVDFKNIIDTTRKRLPFGIAQAGKAFRNEITPGNFIFRTREFEQMEIEYFCEEKDWEKWFDHWLGEMKKWLKHLGVSEKKIHYREVSAEDRAHYSKRTVDVDYDYPFGNEELYGLAYRTDFDLKNHSQASGQDLSYADPEDPKKKFIPHVIEPTWGVDRSVLVAMLEAYEEEQAPTARSTSSGQAEEGESATRVVMKFPHWLAPVKVAVLPLSKKPELSKLAKKIFDELSEKFVCEYDETQSIGRRYRRQDEIGTPFCVTIDFDSAKKKDVTVRDRDSMKQKRIKIAKLEEYLINELRI
ncbi:MAG: glycine--tRNA ligase [Candidatus Harrisonbacteria bacterium]|nr:glycine--tRNA ligase [Candidatus Harrisonbacteria bacterium]